MYSFPARRYDYDVHYTKSLESDYVEDNCVKAISNGVMISVLHLVQLLPSCGASCSESRTETRDIGTEARCVSAVALSQ